MRAVPSSAKQRFAFTLTDLLATLVVLAFLALLLAAGAGVAATTDRRTECAAQLNTIGQGLAACYAENNDYGPTWDDGNTVNPGVMLTWADLLYDLSYISHPRLQVCPDDLHPDEPTRLRGQAWGFQFVGRFHVGEPLKYGERSSYALNAIMNWNFKQDRFADASRQVYAMDGWWSWLGCLNAAWVYYEQVMGHAPPSPVDWPNWEGTMVGWRHGAEFSANVLYADGDVAQLTPLVPHTQWELLNSTVDTMQTFTWLPGEQNVRFDFDAYHGQVPEYEGLYPYFTNPAPGTYKETPWGKYPVDFPDSLDCNWRTVHRLWTKLPADPDDRY